MNAGHAYIHALRNATMERRGSLDIWTFNNTYLAEQIRHSKVATNHHSDIGSPVLVYDEWSRGLHSEVLTQHGEDEALAPLICRDSDGRAFFVPTMGELMAALDATASDDPYAIAEVLNLTVVDIEAARMVGWCDEHRYNPGWYWNRHSRRLTTSRSAQRFMERMRITPSPCSGRTSRSSQSSNSAPSRRCPWSTPSRWQVVQHEHRNH